MTAFWHKIQDGENKREAVDQYQRQPQTSASDLNFCLLNTFSFSLLVLHAQDVCHSDEDWKDMTC